MYIYKFTHTDTGRCYIVQTIQEPNKCKKLKEKSLRNEGG